MNQIHQYLVITKTSSAGPFSLGATGGGTGKPSPQPGLAVRHTHCFSPHPSPSPLTVLFLRNQHHSSTPWAGLQCRSCPHPCRLPRPGGGQCPPTCSGAEDPQSLAGAACLCSGQGTGLFIHSFISINPPPARCSLCVLCSCSCWPCSLPWAEPPPWLWSRDLCSAQLQPCTGAVCCHLELTFPISWVGSIPSDHCCLLSLQLHAGLCDPGWRRPRLLELVFHFLGCWCRVCSW